MKISVLSSGSFGNCFYIENKDNGILVDAGISCSKICEKLSFLGKTPADIKGIFVSHEHIDHVRGVDVLARNFSIPIFATKGTIKNSFLCSDESLINKIHKNEILSLAGMEIEAFSKSHDAEEPVSFNIRNGKMISVITDIGGVCKNVITSVNNCDFLVMEANHDLTMLDEGPYPYFLKERIKSDRGHLSNLHAGLCVLEHANSKLRNIMLAHLSEVNNTPALAFHTFSSLMKDRLDLKPRILVCGRTQTGLFSV